jgi:hypothetical protein
LPWPRISAVGTYHNPVSPENVVVAGRTESDADVGAVDGGWVPDVGV